MNGNSTQTTMDLYGTLSLDEVEEEAARRLGEEEPPKNVPGSAYAEERWESSDGS